MEQVLVDFIGKYKERVDTGIAEELERRQQEVKEISPHLVKIIETMKELSVGGKRLRAMLTILGYEIAKGEVESEKGEVIKAAVMMEIFHLGLLIQDDFMDKDVLRRGVKTMIARYDDRHVGNFVSMLAGDFTFGWGIEILSSLNLPAANVNKGMQVWGKYFTRVGYGQTLDGLAIADEKTILQILELKSGEYSCVLPLVLGATLGGAKPELIEKLKKYGMEQGWVFQLRDDWLGKYGDESKTGKPVGNDSREGKHTFATMHGKEKTEVEIEAHMRKGRELTSGFFDLSGDSRKVLAGLVEWVGTREN
jgi:geranylgeranyl diphosphate synthase type I